MFITGCKTHDKKKKVTSHFFQTLTHNVVRSVHACRYHISQHVLSPGRGRKLEMGMGFDVCIYFVFFVAYTGCTSFNWLIKQRSSEATIFLFVRMLLCTSTSQVCAPTQWRISTDKCFILSFYSTLFFIQIPSFFAEHSLYSALQGFLVSPSISAWFGRSTRRQ